MGQFFVSKIFLGILSFLFLPISFFYPGKVVPVSPAVQPGAGSVVVSSTSPNASGTQPTTLKLSAQSGKNRERVATTTAQVIPNKSISTPGALIVAPTVSTRPTGSVSGNTLNNDEIIALVNIERGKAGLAPLTQNPTLSLEAQAKALDMINKQYFAHVAPDGTDLAALAKKYGYDFLNAGENLALGDFHSSAEVMSGWMNSPGHRANILNKEFTEIGVAAVEGNWKGETVWFAVQEFGRSSSACSTPDPLLKKKITIYQDEISSLDVTLKDLLAEIDTAGDDQATLLAKTNDYNTIVATYNSLVITTKAAISQYNSEVQAFNMCAGF